MGDFKPSSNPQVVSPLRVNVVRGLSGKTLEIVRQYSSKGDDISSQFANDLTDLDVTKIGAMIRRPGFSKTSTTGVNYSIRSIFMVSLGGVKYYGVDYYGVDYAGNLYFYDPLDLVFPEDEPYDDWPTGWPIPPTAGITGARNDRPSDDASADPEDQPCKVGVTWSSSPTSLTYSMHRGGPVPTTQRFYMMRRGWALLTSYVTVSEASTWMEVFSNTGWSWINGQCDGVMVIPTNVPVNGKDSSGNWLDRAVYGGLISALTNSGDSMLCTVALTVIGPVITLSAATLDYPTASTFDITNTGDTGSTLAWAYSLEDVASELVGKVTLSPESASLAKSASSSVTVTIDTTGVAAGTYTFAIRIYDTLYTTDYKDVAVTVAVTPFLLLDSSGTFNCFSDSGNNNFVCIIKDTGTIALNYTCEFLAETIPAALVGKLTAPASGTLTPNVWTVLRCVINTNGVAVGTYSGTKLRVYETGNPSNYVDWDITFGVF